MSELFIAHEIIAELIKLVTFIRYSSKHAISIRFVKQQGTLCK